MVFPIYMLLMTSMICPILYCRRRRARSRKWRKVLWFYNDGEANWKSRRTDRSHASSVYWILMPTIYALLLFHVLDKNILGLCLCTQMPCFVDNLILNYSFACVLIQPVMAMLPYKFYAKLSYLFFLWNDVTFLV